MKRFDDLRARMSEQAQHRARERTAAMSDTPRTDKHHSLYCISRDRDGVSEDYEYVESEFARELERELAVANDRLEAEAVGNNGLMISMNAMMRERDELKRALSEGAFPKWTPLTTPPSHNGWFITYNPEWPEERPCMYFDGVWHWNDDDGTPMTEGDKYPITHWMPLPEAPK